jgi:phospholipid/cholesterol/gamma-HCH transport system ATP-binding protein
VSKAFGHNTPLRDVSFTVPKGEALCILGRSGTGKSVTLKLMIGLLKADRGKVLIDGEDIGTLDEDGLSRVRRKMGFLFQSAALFDSFSLGDNLALPLHRLDKTKSKDEIKTIVDQALDEVGLKKDKDKLPVELSGGMRKRAGLARALVLKPEILLADEPSSGLDRITSSEIDELLMKVKTERHTTVVVVTHDIRGARRLGDHFAILDQGDLVGFGTASELEKSENKLVREFISEA